MSHSPELLALRKEMLVTRAAVERLRVAQQVEALQENARLPRIVSSLARSRQTRGALLSLAVMVAGRGTLGRWLRRAAMLVSAAGVARSVFEAARATSGARSASPAQKPPPS